MKSGVLLFDPVERLLIGFTHAWTVFARVRIMKKEMFVMMILY